MPHPRKNISLMSGGFGGVTVGISLIDGGPFAKYKG